MTYEVAANPQRNDAQLNGIGISNVQLKTSNGYSPHMFPEYITDWVYYYGSAARPGFMGRFLVGETSIRAPYWPVSPNAFGGQINASPNGDSPGDIYRLMGGRGAAAEGRVTGLCRLHRQRVPAAQGHQQQPRDRGRDRRSLTVVHRTESAGSSWWARGRA